MPVIIGIDPGITGAIARISQSFAVQVQDMPVMAKGKGSSKIKNQVNASALYDILKDWGGMSAIIYCERISAMPGQGVSSMFSMGDSFGVIRGVCASIGYPIELITPRQWKIHFSLSSDKEICRAKAIELFPNMPLEKKKHHNRAEALLIAQYGYEMIAKKYKHERDLAYANRT